MQPRLTVLLPVYNGGDYLRPAIESILQQTFTDFEFLIIDDGSIDDSADIIASYHDPRIRATSNPQNLRLAATLNKGIELARGEYIARMDCDDIALPTRLEKQLDYLQKHPEIGVLGTNYQLISPSGKTGARSRFPSEHAVLRWRLCFGCYIAHPTVMIRKSIYQQLNGYRTDVTGEDYDLWVRAASHTRLANLPDILHQIRRHASSSSSVQATLLQPENIAISQKEMTRILGFSPSPGLVGQIRMWKFESPAEGRRAASLIAQLCRASLADKRLEAYEKQLIRTDAAKWLIHLARKTHAWSALALAWQLDPLLPLRLPFLILRFLTRQSPNR
ncbi:MAG: glycosyltransferase [Chloroflexota bacterium]